MVQRTLLLLLFCLTSCTLLHAQPDTTALSVRLNTEIPKRYGTLADGIIARSRLQTLNIGYRRLTELCNTFGPRFSGTPNLERAIDWLLDALRRDGFDNVHGEPVTVPRWVRGNESCTMILPREKPMAMLGLGGSIATPPEGITAEVMVVTSFDDLAKRAGEARGKIVLFNVPFTNYGETVQYRVNGAIQASKAGAVASLIRSVTPYSLYTPHTGVMYYNDSVPKIPHAAITIEDAELITGLLRSTPAGKVTLRLVMRAQTLPDTTSRNVIAQITGTEKPEEVLVFGGHIDSWDVGSGALDDGAGCIAVWEALRLIKMSGLKPKRTIRLVFWTNEENGTRGAKEYARVHGGERNILALETDGGIFKPTGFGFTGNDSMLVKVRAIASLLKPLGADTVVIGGGGADIGPLGEKKVPMMDLRVEASRYFWFHHTNADTPDKIRPEDINECAAALAVMMYVMADL